MQIKTIMRYHLTLVRMTIIEKSTNAGEGVQKRKASYTVGGNANWLATMKNRLLKTQQIERRANIRYGNSTPRHIPRQNCNLKRYMHSHVHSNTIYNSQDKEAT